MTPAAWVAAGAVALAVWTAGAVAAGYLLGWWHQRRSFDHVVATAAEVASHAHNKPPVPASAGERHPPARRLEPGTPAGEAGPPPGREPPLPGPVPNDFEREALGKIEAARPSMHAQAVGNAERIADGLRLRFETVPDTTIGLIVLEVARWCTRAIVASPRPDVALTVISHALGLCAEEMTRLARQEETSDGRT